MEYLIHLKDIRNSHIIYLKLNKKMREIYLPFKHIILLYNFQRNLDCMNLILKYLIFPTYQYNELLLRNKTPLLYFTKSFHKNQLYHLFPHNHNCSL